MKTMPSQNFGFLGNAPLPVAVFSYKDGALCLRYASPALQKAVNKKGLDSFSNNFHLFFHPEASFLSILSEKEKQSCETKGHYQVVYHAVLADGLSRCVFATGEWSTKDPIPSLWVSYTLLSSDEEKSLSDPTLRFLNESFGAMVIVSQVEKEILYFNDAALEMLHPAVAFHAPMTFRDYFYSDVPGGITGLFDMIDLGPHPVEEPRTKRQLEVSVVSSSWREKPAYALYFYEAKTTRKDDELRHKREIFNSLMFAGRGNGLEATQNGYSAYRIWNLSKNRFVYSDGFRFFGNDKPTYDDYRRWLFKQCDKEEDKIFLQKWSAQRLLASFDTSSYPQRHTFAIFSSKGTLSFDFAFFLCRSPDTDALYLRIHEENVTAASIEETLIQKTVEEDFDYIAYCDLTSSHVKMIFGHGPERDFSLDDYLRKPDGLEQLFPYFGFRFKTLDLLTNYLKEKAGTAREFTETIAISQDLYKCLFVKILDAKCRCFYLSCRDVTTLLKEEKLREKELSIASEKVLKANEGLESAVLAERTRADKLSIQTLFSVCATLDARDKNTSQHSGRVAFYAQTIAKKLGWDNARIRNIYNISLVHDIGKIGIPDAILFKKGPLTGEEYDVIKKHASIGAQILANFAAIDNVATGVRHHHERYDGKGYPDGLAGESIPIESRIIALADAVDAMASDRLYRPHQPVSYILSELRREKGHQFDPALDDIMISLIQGGILSYLPESENKLSY